MGEKTHGVIYALSDPRNPRLPRYIGQTRDSLKRRLWHHLSAVKQAPHRELHKWIAALKTEKLIPVIYVLESVTNLDLTEREIAWITFFKPLGMIFNQSDGPGMLGMKNPMSEATREKQSIARTGKSMSVLQRTKWIEANGKANFHGPRKPIKSSDGKFRFSSIVAAAKYLGVSFSSVQHAVDCRTQCLKMYWEVDGCSQCDHINPPAPDRKTIRYGKISDEQRVEIISLKEQGITQGDIAARFGVHQSEISRILNNKRRKVLSWQQF